MTEIGGLPPHVAAPDPSIYWSDNYVTLDFETTTLFKGSPLIDANRIILACWNSNTMEGRSTSRTMQHRFGGEYDLEELSRVITSADFVVAHNAKFELGWLRRCGVDLRKVVVYDTMIGEYVRGGNRYNLVQLGLDACLKRYHLAPKEDLIGKMLKAGIDTEDMPESWLLSYCERDVQATEELFLLQREVLKEKGLIHLQYQRCLVTPALCDMEFYGMQLDDKMVHKEIEQQDDEYARKTEELQRFMGGALPSSPKQKGEYIYNVLKFKVPKDYKGKPMLTKSGTPSSAAEVLERLKSHTKKQEDFLKLHKEWAALHSDVTKYLRKFELCCNEADGLLQAVFNQCVARTHRLSSSGFEFKVQFQNLNRKFKLVFKARREGWLMGEADGAQLEFRTAVHMGRDAKGLHDITHGVDVHQFTADVIGCSRQDAKAHTFKPLYGGRSGTPGEQAYYKAFAEKYVSIAKTQKGWTHTVLDNKQLRTEYGLLFYWPGCTMTHNGYIIHTTNIYNYPVQGFATAEIIPLALVCAWHRMANMKSFLVNTVHDSIVAELHPDEVELWHKIGQQCLIDDCYTLLTVLYGVHLTVPLGTGIQIGTHWANKEAKRNEVVYEADPKLYLKAAEEAEML